MKRTDADKEKLRELGKKNFDALKHTEFKCPICGGIATVCLESGSIRSECHACSTWVLERM